LRTWGQYPPPPPFTTYGGELDSTDD